MLLCIETPKTLTMNRKDITVLCALIATFCIGAVNFIQAEQDIRKDVATFIYQFDGGYLDDAQICQEVVTYANTKFDSGTNTISSLLSLDFSSVIWRSYSHYAQGVVMNEKAMRLFLKDPKVELHNYEEHFLVGLLLIIFGLIVLFAVYILYTKYDRANDGSM